MSTKIVEEINISKAAGPDLIPGRMLNMLAPELAPIVHAIFTQSLDTGELPRDWSLANVAPIFKKGNRVLAENYRPVSLTCITCKLFEHIVCGHILNHVEDHKILTNLQHGFRSGRSCETQLITTTHELLSSFNSKSQIDVAILDFSKAFDTVPHAGLLGKLEHYGIDSKILLWITNFLNNRKQRVVVDGSFSNYADVESGILICSTVYYYGANQIMLTKLLNYKREPYARYPSVDQLHILNHCSKHSIF